MPAHPTLPMAQEGRIAEQGTHAQLLAAGGAYAALVQRQLLANEQPQQGQQAQQADGGVATAETQAGAA